MEYDVNNLSYLCIVTWWEMEREVSKINPAWEGLTHWGRVTHICVSKLTIIGSDNGLSSGWRQAIIWTNVGILLIGPLGTNFSEMLIEIHTFSSKKIHLKMLSVKWRPFGLGLNVLTCWRDHRLSPAIVSTLLLPWSALGSNLISTNCQKQLIIIIVV